MRLKVSEVRRNIKGLHPKEVVAVINTLTGPEELVLFLPSGGAVGSIEIGYPIAMNADNYLVELPSETTRGAWRVWVNREQTEEDAMEAAE
jgi:hypothetical protein